MTLNRNPSSSSILFEPELWSTLNRNCTHFEPELWSSLNRNWGSYDLNSRSQQGSQQLKSATRCVAECEENHPSYPLTTVGGG